MGAKSRGKQNLKSICQFIRALSAHRQTNGMTRMSKIGLHPTLSEVYVMYKVVDSRRKTLLYCSERLSNTPLQHHHIGHKAFPLSKYRSVCYSLLLFQSLHHQLAHKLQTMSILYNLTINHLLWYLWCWS